MKKALLLATGLLLFGCETKTTTTETETNTTETETTETTTAEDVEIGAGTEISPQLKGVEDSATRLKVDTINSAQEADQNTRNSDQNNQKK